MVRESSEPAATHSSAATAVDHLGVRADSGITWPGRAIAREIGQFIQPALQGQARALRVVRYLIFRDCDGRTSLQPVRVETLPVSEPEIQTGKLSS